jgi:hypothetical protein
VVRLVFVGLVANLEDEEQKQTKAAFGAEKWERKTKVGLSPCFPLAIVQSAGGKVISRCRLQSTAFSSSLSSSSASEREGNVLIGGCAI